MKYEKTITLRNGKELLLRNGDEADGEAVFQVFNQTHEETDFLLSYPDENSMNAKQEAEFLKEKTASDKEIEMLAVVDGTVVGTAGIWSVGEKYKVKHRAEFGISIIRDYWGMGIGKHLTEACISCAKQAGYKQLELDVVGDNPKAINLYQSFGFVEFGRNPKGFYSRISGDQELVYMRLEL